jgi:hypothetical protein
MVAVRRAILAMGGLATVPPFVRACSNLDKIGQTKLHSIGKPWSYSKTGVVERFEVRAGEHWKGEHSERSEIAIYRFMRRLKDVWQAFSLYVEPGVVASKAPWRIFSQWHALKDPWDDYTSPPVAQLLVGDSFRIWTVSDSSLRQSVKRYPHPIIRYQNDRFECGRWHHFVYRIRFDAFGAGALQTWMNGEEIINLNNIPIGYNDLVGPYFKYGVYRPPSDDFALAAQYANMELGYTSLERRISNPLPV